MSTSYIDVTTFKARYGITINTYDGLIGDLLQEFSDSIEQYTGTQFTLSSETKKFYGDPAGSTFIHIRPWQSSSLVIQKSEVGSTNPTNLIEGTDYRLMSVANLDSTIYGVSLFNHCLYSTEYLIVSGQYGWSNTLPSNLKTVLRNAVLSALNYSQGLASGSQSGNGGSGAVESIKDLTTSINYASASEYSHYGGDLANGNLLAVPSIRDTLDYYRNYSVRQFKRT